MTRDATATRCAGCPVGSYTYIKRDIFNHINMVDIIADVSIVGHGYGVARDATMGRGVHMHLVAPG
jgi:hypothetical protein